MQFFFYLIFAVLLIRGMLPNLTTKKAQKWYLFITAIPIIVLMSFRYEIIQGSGDIWGYYEFYKSASELSLGNLFKQSNFEPGYVILNKAFAEIVPYPQFIYFLEALICVAAISRFIYKYSESPCLSIIFYITLGTMIFELTAVRQGIAMSICLFSVEFIDRRKPIIFILLVLLAVTFHKTAIAFFPLYWAAKIKPTMVNIILSMTLIVVSLLCSRIIINYANTLFNMGYGQYVGNEFGGWAPILIFLIALFFMLLSPHLKKQSLIFNMLLMGLAIYLLRYTALAAERISFYFTPAVIIAIPKGIDWIPERLTRYSLYVASSLLAVALYVYRFIRIGLT